MSDKPILFSAPMVRAILDGTLPRWISVARLGRPAMNDELRERIMAKVEITGECWLWSGGMGGKRSCPEMRYRGQHVNPRRALFEDEHGELGKSYLVSSCGNQRCVNPAHYTVIVPMSAAEKMAKRLALEAKRGPRRAKAKQVKRQAEKPARAGPKSRIERVRELARQFGFDLVRTSKDVYEVRLV